jgi:hypothetical protein
LLISIWYLATVVGDKKIKDNTNFRQIAGNSKSHVDAAVRHRAHCSMEHIQGYTRSHWMLPSGKCLRRIALPDAMVDEFVENTHNTTKTQLLASNYGTN